MSVTRTPEGDLMISNKNVLWHVLFEATEEVPFAFHVFVLDDLATLQELVDGPDAAFARTFMYDEPDADNAIGTIYLAAGWVYVGMIAHEAVHLASWMLKTVGTDLGPIGEEHEGLAELVGTLTSIVWYNVERAGHATVDETEDDAEPEHPGVDTETHWANGLPRLLKPEAFDRISAEKAMR